MSKLHTCPTCPDVPETNRARAQRPNMPKSRPGTYKPLRLLCLTGYVPNVPEIIRKIRARINSCNYYIFKNTCPTCPEWFAGFGHVPKTLENQRVTAYARCPKENQNGADIKRIYLYILFMSALVAGMKIGHAQGGGMQEIKLNLPWPPSVNGLWRKAGKRVILSAQARSYYLTLASLLVVARAKKLIPRESIDYRVEVSFLFHPPDQRTRDIDNYTKAIFDGLTKGRFWIDDELVKREIREWGEPVKGGLVVVRVKKLEENAK